MRWQGGKRSTNVEDRRGMKSGGLIAGGGIGAVVLALVAVFLGVDPQAVIESNPGAVQQQGELGVPEDEMGQFVSAVLGDTELAWDDIFRREVGRPYEPPTLVLFSGSTRSACGYGVEEMGPFYCPLDRKVYIDLSFYDALKTRFGAPGDFAEAYVIAHEVGHHVQTLLGTSEQVHAARSRAGRAAGNELSVRQELQADCYAGMWARHAERGGNVALDPGDLEEALTAAAAIGDDRLQKEAGGRVSPDSFTHGTSAQRSRWFRRGWESGSLEACDTFRATSL
jgi:uncharacterized protein